ncbi:MAG: hypothetical protein HS111_16605 [Kofleriaceae bacterium]|nr:hypothetical protein [Kofleriaceae bacterium]
MHLRLGLVTALVATLAGTASADVLSLRAEAHGGGAGGLGVAGDRKDDAFQNNARGAPTASSSAPRSCSSTSGSSTASTSARAPSPVSIASPAPGPSS